jgi:hypothetical protein
MLFYPIHESHLSFSHKLCKQQLTYGSFVVDATAGNGKDSLFLANLILKENKGHLWSLDIQEKAITNTKKILEENLDKQLIKNISLINQCHSLPLPSSPSLDLVVYNLGYLPGGNKKLCTKTNTTLLSIRYFLKLLKQEGALCITCYPGHEEGAEEYYFLLRFFQFNISPYWKITHYFHPNKPQAPNIFWISN